MAFNFFRSVFQQANQQGSRSTTLNPLGWLIAMLLLGLIAFIKYNAMPWMVVTGMVLLGAVVVMYLVGYTYFMIKSPEHLRSERYSLSRYAMEKGIFGDSLKGVLEATDSDPKNIGLASATEDASEQTK